MTKTKEVKSLIDGWKHIPHEIKELIDGLSDQQIASMPGSEELTVTEVVHHIVEANIVAASMIIAALGASGSTYDWSWLWSDKKWTERLGYNNMPIEASVKTLESLTEHISNLVVANDETLKREVKVFDSPGAKPYAMTVAQIIQQEIDHAAQHLGDVRKSF